MNAGAIIVGKTNLSVCLSPCHLLPTSSSYHCSGTQLLQVCPTLSTRSMDRNRITSLDSEDLRWTAGGLQWGAKVNPRMYAEAFALTTAFLGIA